MHHQCVFGENCFPVYVVNLPLEPFILNDEYCSGDIIKSWNNGMRCMSYYVLINRNAKIKPGKNICICIYMYICICKYMHFSALH